MFADRVLIPGTGPRVYDRLDMLLASVKSSVKFQLAQDFAVAADALSRDLAQVEKVLPYCRPPYPVTWIEVSQAFRRSFTTADLRDYEREISHVAFLVQALPGCKAAFMAFLFWGADEPTVRSLAIEAPIALGTHDWNTCLMGILADPLAELDEAVKVRMSGTMQYADSAAFGRIFRPTVGIVGSNFLDLINKLGDKAAQTMIQQSFETDWGGEVGYLAAALGLMNARNTSVVEYIDKTEHNQKRIRRAKPPLLSHYLLKIHPRQKVFLHQDRRTNGHAELRAHFVRGHFKVRRTGIFWWSPFMRGDLKHGYAVKDYEVAV